MKGIMLLQAVSLGRQRIQERVKTSDQMGKGRIRVSGEELELVKRLYKVQVMCRSNSA